MNAGTRQPQHGIARHHAARQQVTALRRAHREARKIGVTLAVQPGHLRRLAADQCAAGLVAARGDAGDHLAVYPLLKAIEKLDRYHGLAWRLQTGAAPLAPLAARDSKDQSIP